MSPSLVFVVISVVYFSNIGMVCVCKRRENYPIYSWYHQLQLCAINPNPDGYCRFNTSMNYCNYHLRLQNRQKLSRQMQYH